MTNRISSPICALGALLATVGFAAAAPQKFAHSYEAKTLSAGQWEFEHNVTWERDHGDNAFTFEHELEYGITDKLQISLLAEWSHEPGESSFGHAGVEAIYQISSPTDGIGSALIAETAIGDEEFVLEGRLALSKDAGPFTFVYNVGLEAAWEGSDYDEKVGEFAQSFGVSYALSQQFMVGVEGFHTMEFADWDETEVNSLHIGPNIGFRSGSFWAVVAAGWEVTNDDDAPDFVGKVRFGFVF